MKTPIEVPIDLILFIWGSLFLYLGIKDRKKANERKKKASKFNEFGFIEDKWSYVDVDGYKYVFLLGLGILLILVVMFHLLEKYLS
ncbi:MAG: hypothetical protein PHR83_05010 [Paludibacter sp.]|nr:hypothetical protein [Paludibacter sp.]